MPAGVCGTGRGKNAGNVVNKGPSVHFLYNSEGGEAVCSVCYWCSVCMCRAAKFPDHCVYCVLPETPCGTSLLGGGGVCVYRCIVSLFGGRWVRLGEDECYPVYYIIYNLKECVILCGYIASITGTGRICCDT